MVKFSSINLFGLRFVRKAWPDVPCVFVVCDRVVLDPAVGTPAEVLVSSLHEQGWLAHKGRPGQRARLDGWNEPETPFEAMSNEEDCGHLRGRNLQAALEAVESARDRDVA